VRARFVLSEVLTDLQRNLTMTIAVVLTVAISAAGLGVAWLMREQVQTTKSFWYGNIDVQVYLTPTVDQTERDTIRNTLVQLPLVESVHYVSQAEAFQRAQVLFKDSPSLLKNITQHSLPESYLVKLKDPRKFAVVSSAVQNLPGVDQVATGVTILRKIFRFIDGMQRAALVLSLVVFIVAVLLIFNTVRLSAFSRRRETGIMRLVGASDLMIQGPFVIEGAASGFVGSLFALGLLSLFKIVFVDHGIASLAPTATPYVGWGTVAGIFPFLVLLGVLVSALISGATLQRYLRV
jgi:cell division transport system permease protein